MKNKTIKRILAFIIISNVFFSCKTQSISDNNLPDIINPKYSIYSTHEEKGYNVSFELNKKSPKPVAIVLNKIKQDIHPEDINGKKVKINVISNTRINHYKVKVYNSIPNGIMFNINGVYHLKPVNFKLKHSID